MIRKHYVSTHIFFENGGKKLRFQTNTDTCERYLRRVPKIASYISLNNTNSPNSADTY